MWPIYSCSTSGVSKRLKVVMPTADSYMIQLLLNVSFTNYGGSDFASARTGRFVPPLKRFSYQRSL